MSVKYRTVELNHPMTDAEFKDATKGGWTLKSHTAYEDVGGLLTGGGGGGGGLFGSLFGFLSGGLLGGILSGVLPGVPGVPGAAGLTYSYIFEYAGGIASNRAI